jgi:hypothetical protein
MIFIIPPLYSSHLDFSSWPEVRHSVMLFLALLLTAAIAV